MQRRAGNRAVGALLRAARRQVQRSVEDDLREPSARVAPTGQVELPPGTGLLTEAGRRWRVPVRVYAIEDLPAELDPLSIRTDERWRFLPGTLAERLRELERSGKDLTIGEMRASTAAKPSERCLVAIGRHEGRLRVLGVDTFELPRPGMGMGPGFVFKADETQGIGQALFTGRIRLAVQAGLPDVKVTVGNSDDTLKFHRRLVGAARLGLDVGTGDNYTLRPQHMANLLAEWDRSLTPQARAALRIAATRPDTRTADLVPLVVHPPAAQPAPPAKPPVTPAAAGPGERRAARGAGALVLVLLRPLLDLLKDKANDREQKAVSHQLESYSNAIAAHQAGAPQDGALVRVSYRRAELPDASGPDKLAWIEVGYGRTESEARADIDRQATARPTLGANERLSQHEQWIEPPAPASADALRPPFPRAGVGGIRGTTLTLQNVKWDGAGFDDEDTDEIAVAREEDIRFSILRVPARLAGQNVPVESRSPREGPSVPSVDLDPGTPFADVHAVAVFPANEITRAAFERAPATSLRAPLGPFPNLELVRWVRPEHLRVLADR